MNYVKTTPVNLPATQVTMDDCATCCDHIESNDMNAVLIVEEHDSFGPVGEHYLCSECANEYVEAQKNKEVECFDCDKSFLLKDMIQFTHFGYDPVNDGEPLYICKECSKLPHHRQRVLRKRQEEDEFFGDDED